MAGSANKGTAGNGQKLLLTLGDIAAFPGSFPYYKPPGRVRIKWSTLAASRAAQNFLIRRIQTPKT